MENPAGWGLAEKVIHQAHQDYWKDRSTGKVGHSLPRRIADALRAAGLLRDEGEKT